ncbi:MAG: precorrin-6y C5,15-methyltransferase (decarboxylating) subunit CbiE [Syntrophobacteraceae bacterium]
MTVQRQIQPDEWSLPLVLLVGMGAGPEDLTAATHRWLSRAEVLFGGKRHLEQFGGHPAMKLSWESPLERSFERVLELSIRLRTAILASGDPFFFGIGRKLVARLGSERVYTLPGVSSVQLLFARIGEPWENAKVVSLHGRAVSMTDGSWVDLVRVHSRVVLFTDARHTPDQIARTLIDAGLEECSLVVGENLGMLDERVSELALRDAAAGSFAPLNLVLVKSVSLDPGNGGRRDEQYPLFGLPESAYAHEAGLITKKEVRAIVMAHLELRPGLSLWDIGAGSGSVSIEAARLAPLGRAFAIERNEARYRDLKQNIARLAPSRVRAIHGRAPDHLADLPDPDRVFIGGSGGELDDLLAAIMARLRPGGIIVQTAVSLDTVTAARTFWKQRSGYSLELLQVQVSRAVPIGGSERLDPQNPVFVMKVTKAS